MIKYNSNFIKKKTQKIISTILIIYNSFNELKTIIEYY